MIRLARGAGIVLDTDGGPFHAARLRAAGEAGRVASWLARTRPDRAGLTIGDLLLAPGVPAILDSGGLARHTFMCGQSGSGKTYSLGLLLERVLAETSLRVVILDANSDYVGLPRPRDGADPGWQPATRTSRARSPCGGTTQPRTIPSGCGSPISSPQHRQPLWPGPDPGPGRVCRADRPAPRPGGRHRRW